MIVTVKAQNGIAIVTIDNPPVNAAGHAVREGLMQALARTDADVGVSAVVLACAGKTFVGGADIREFGQPPAPPLLPDVVRAIEGSAKPWVAAIHGTALGGGLELALACRARVADATARLGLPEVKLGLVPGAGGTVLLPRVVSAELALDMIAVGRLVGAPEALAAGLVDAIADADLLDAATAFARTRAADRPGTLSRPPTPPADRAKFDANAERLVARARGQVSVPEAVAQLDRALSLPADAALKAERAAFVRLRDSPQSAALRYIFFAERATLKDPRCVGPSRALGAVGIVGGGTMGAGIAAACLLAGLPVSLVERDAAAADAARARVTAILDEGLARGKLTPDARAALDAKFAAVSDFASLAEADLVIEAVFEDPDLKRAVFSALDAATRADAILATNTSYLDVNRIAQAVGDPSRVIGLHFFSPAHVMKLLEIVVAEDTADDVVATAAGLSKILGKTGVLSGVADGFIGNRIMNAYRHEAFRLLEEGASPWQVDRAMRDHGWPMGVFQMQDLAGLDIGFAMRRRRQATHPDEARSASVADRLVALDRLGRKTGRGWYLYDQAGGATPDPEVDRLIEEDAAAKGLTRAPLSDTEVIDRILNALWAEADRCLADGTARSEDDVDVVMVAGYGFPRWRGGPMYQRRTG